MKNKDNKNEEVVEEKIEGESEVVEVESSEPEEPKKSKIEAIKAVFHKIGGFIKNPVVIGTVAGCAGLLIGSIVKGSDDDDVDISALGDSEEDEDQAKNDKDEADDVSDDIKNLSDMDLI